MTEIISRIVKDILIAIYQPFWFTVLASVLAMFFVLYAKEHGWKESVLIWLKQFQSNSEFRKTFLLVFYTMLILFKTLLNRDMWLNPLSHVMGGWFLYDAKGNLSTEPIENFMLFIPFMILLFWAKGDVILKGKRLRTVLWNSFKITFCFSLTIEMLQVILRLGTFQLADLTYNTLGGIFGGFLFWIYSWMRKP